MRGVFNLGRVKERGVQKGCSFLLTAAMVVTGCLSGLCFENRLSGVQETAKADGDSLENPRWNSDNTVSTWDCVWFGNYWQEDTNGDGVADKNDRKTPIKWRVLNVDTIDNEIFLMADTTLDCKRYNETEIDMTWENCTVRSWLNGYSASKNTNGVDYTSKNFINEAFCEKERSVIKEGNVDNSETGGNDTVDKIFLLSKAEVKNANFGFETIATYANGVEYTTRLIKPTAFAKKNGVSVNSTGNASWWLRSSDVTNAKWAVNIGNNGSFYNGVVYLSDEGVRPALKLNLSSDIFTSGLCSYAGTVSSDGTVNEETPLMPLNAPQRSEHKVTWDCVYFGHYWQEDTNGDGNADKEDAMQPIKWRVLAVDGDEVTLLADKNLDLFPFNTSVADISEVTWKNSSIRSWLNAYDGSENLSGTEYDGKSFYNNAFSVDERDLIKEKNMGDGAYDKVCLLGDEILMNESYGFSNGHIQKSTVKVKNSSFAAMQAYEPKEAGSWWLCIPWNYVNEGGEIIEDDNIILDDNNNDGIGVRPVIKLDLSAPYFTNFVSYAGTVSADITSDDSGDIADAPGVSRDGKLELPQSVSLVKGRTKLITGKIWGKNQSEVMSLANSLTFHSGDSKVATLGVADAIMHNDYLLLVLNLSSPEDGAYGETDISAEASDGSKVTCHVVTGKSKGTEEDEYNGCYSVVGTLDSITTSGTPNAKISGGTYGLEDASVLSAAQTILNKGTGKVVAARIDQYGGIAGNSLKSICAVEDILKPSVELQPVDEAGEPLQQIEYVDGKYSVEQFKIDVIYSCEVASPYQLSDLSGVPDWNVSKGFSELELSEVSSVCYASADDEIPPTSVDSSADAPFHVERTAGSSAGSLEFSLAPGETRVDKGFATASIQFSRPGNASEQMTKTCFMRILNETDSETSGIMYLLNFDQDKQDAEEEYAESDYGKALDGMSASMEKIVPVAPDVSSPGDGSGSGSSSVKPILDQLGETDLAKYFSKNELLAMSAQVKNWLYCVNGMNILLNGSKENEVKKFLSDSGIPKEKFQELLMNRLGIIKNPDAPVERNAITFEGMDKDGQEIVVKFTAETGYRTQVSGGMYGTVFGNIEYKISTGETGSGQIVYAGSDTYKDKMYALMKSQLEHCFTERNAKNDYPNMVAEAFVNTTFASMASATYGTGEEQVTTELYVSDADKKNTEERLRNITIHLSREELSHSRRVSAFCPVDMYAYDFEGNERCAIIDDKVTKRSKGILAYVKGDEKHMVITDGRDYQFVYASNDNGSMTYVIEDYEGGEMARSVTYTDVALEKAGDDETTYTNYLTGNKKGNDILNKLRDKYGKIIEDVPEEKCGKRIGVTRLSLDRQELTLSEGESFTLMQMVSPANATNKNVMWRSSNQSVASVSHAGVLYASGEGETMIYAVSEDNGMAESYCKVFVKKKGAKDEPTAAPTSGPGQQETSGGDGTEVTSSEKPAGSAAPKSSAKPTAKPSAKPSASPAVSPGKDGVVQAPWVTTSPTKKPSDGSDTGKPTAKPSSDTTSLKAIVQSAVKAGKVKTKGKKKYVITASASKKKSGQVTVYRTADAGAKSVTIPATVKLGKKKYKVTSIYNYAFDGMSALSKVSIGKNVKIIGEGAFANCTKLKFLLIPKNVTQIRKEAFAGCKRLKYLVVRTSKLKKVGADAFLKTAKSMKVKTPEKKWMEYAKMFKKNGLAENALFLVNPAKIKYKGKTY